LETFNSFNQLALPEPMYKALEQMKFTAPTPVQAEAIPAALEGHDILGTAQTGTGKTGAFAIPLLARLCAEPSKQALILCPTRELAAQIHQVLRQMGRGLGINGTLVVGGESFNRQANELYSSADYIVATPGRLTDHLAEGTANLSHVGFLVLDEVDRMLDMGFAPQIKQVMQHVPSERQTMLFSATLPKEIQGLAAAFLKNPIRVAIGSVLQPVSQVVENTIRTTDQGKNLLILEEVAKTEGRVLVFTRTQHRTDRLARLLFSKGHDVVVLHGGRSQGQRKQALERFRSGTHRIMVATDLAGRGIDVNDINNVINYDLPGNREDYIHRIGRTGRFGKKGNAVNFLVNGDRDGERVLSGAPGSSAGAGGNHGRRPGGGGGGQRSFGSRRGAPPRRMAAHRSAR
jgi:superfamily II DNA/RNA helicase